MNGLNGLAEPVSHEGNNCAKTKAFRDSLLAATEEPFTRNKSFQYVSLSVRSFRYKAYTSIGIKFV